MPRLTAALERWLRPLAGEPASIFTLAFLIALPHELYADLGLQIGDGRTIWAGAFPQTMPYAIEALPPVDHEWLFEAVAWPFWAHGIWPVFAIFCTAVTASTPLFARAIARRCGATSWSANAVGYLSVPGAVTLYAVRPQSFAVVAFAAILWLMLGRLDRPWLPALVTVLWANVHGTVPIGVALAVIVTVARTIAGADAALRRRLLVATGLTALATLATPLGIGLYLGASEYASEARQTADWQTVNFAFRNDLVVAVLYGYVLVTGGVRVSRRHALATSLLGAFGLLWFSFDRCLPFFDVAAVPALTLALGADGAAQGRGARAKRAGSERRAPAWLMAPPIAIALLLGSLAFAPLSTRPETPLRAADELVARTGFSGALFTPFQAGAYLELQQRPVRLLVDSRATSFGPAVWADWHEADFGRPGWRGVFERRGIEGAIVADGLPLADRLARSGAWSACASRDGYTLYARNDRAIRRIAPLRCTLSTGASSPTPIPNSSPRSRAKSGVRSTTSN